MKRFLICMAATMCVTAAHALSITGVSFSDPNIIYETGGIPNGTTITYTIDSPGLMEIDVNCGIVNFGDAGTIVTRLFQNFSGPVASTTTFWNGLWLIGGDQARNSTTCDFIMTLSTNGTSVNPSPAPPSLVTLNSVDIHNLTVASSVDSNGAATFPFVITYALAKSANVSATITNSSGTVVRTLLTNAAQAGESISSQTITWNGLADSGQSVSVGVYTLTVNATDPAVANSHAITRTRSITVQSLAGAAGNPQKLFESNVYVYPNPVRNGSATFQIEAIRDGANLSLKIYTLSGDLVFEKFFPNVAAGYVTRYGWGATNSAGRKLGRGLYYYVVREEDSAGTLQTVKKMAVIP